MNDVLTRGEEKKEKSVVQLNGLRAPRVNESRSVSSYQEKMSFLHFGLYDQSPKAKVSGKLQ